MRHVSHGSHCPAPRAAVLQLALERDLPVVVSPRCYQSRNHSPYPESSSPMALGESRKKRILKLFGRSRSHRGSNGYNPPPVRVPSKAGNSQRNTTLIENPPSYRPAQGEFYPSARVIVCSLRNSTDCGEISSGYAWRSARAYAFIRRTSDSNAQRQRL